MNGAHKLEPPSPPPRPGSSPALQALRDAAIYGTLVAMLLFVMLPLVWMLVTAFKVRGTAFRFEFLPKQTVLAPPAEDRALPVVSVDGSGAWVHVELDRPGATSVAVVERSNAGDPVVRELRLALGGLWTGTFGPIAGETFAYQFLVNGEESLPDPAAADYDAEGFAVLALERGVVAHAGESRLSFHRRGDRLTVRLLDEPGRAWSVRVGETTRVPLLEKQHGVYEAETTDAGDTLRLARRRPMGEAIASLYTAEHFGIILRNEEFNFGRYFMNSLIVATSAALLTVLICTMAGYAFAAKRFHYRDQLFAVLLASMLVPGMIYLVPQFSITLKLGWLNSFQGMVVPHLANVFGLFLLRQYVLQIPKDLFNAAEIDGANNAQVFGTIVVPVCLPIMVTLFLLVFVGQWSNFLWQLIVNTGDPATMTLPVGLQQFKGQNATEWERIMAGACFSILPIAVLFLSLQKYFMRGLTAGAVKE